MFTKARRPLRRLSLHPPPRYGTRAQTAGGTAQHAGIGKAAAIALARGGANVAINCSGSKAQAEEAAAEIRSLGQKAIVIVCDVSDQKAVEAMVQQTVDAFGSLDIFVSNAVYSDRELMVKANMEGFRRTIEVSMWGAMHGVRAAAQQMLKQPIF